MTNIKCFPEQYDGSNKIRDLTEVSHNLSFTRQLIRERAIGTSMPDELLSEKLLILNNLIQQLELGKTKLINRLNHKGITPKGIKIIINDKDNVIIKLMEKLDEEKITPLFKIAVERNKNC